MKQTIKASVSGRLDKVLSQSIRISRNQIEKLIKEGLVEVDQKRITKPSFKVETGQEIAYTFIEAKTSERKEVDFDVEVLLEDEHLMVINKPPGVVVHPALSYSGATLVDWLKQKGVSLSTVSGEERHGIVHRIDKETSGALVVAKTNEAHEKLSAQLQDKSMGRYYLALIDIPLKEDAVVDAPIARDAKNRLKMAVVEGGREAKSAFKKLALSTLGTELIAVKLYTGRTHQIRVHLAHLNRHILGDRLYGFKSKGVKIQRVYLHAKSLYFRHPITGKRVVVDAPLFEDMRHYINKYIVGNENEETIQLDAIDFDTLFAHL